MTPTDKPALTEDELWVLRQAATPGGFSCSAESVKEFAIGLETQGLLLRADNYRYWHITDKGRAALAQHERKT